MPASIEEFAWGLVYNGAYFPGESACSRRRAELAGQAKEELAILPNLHRNGSFRSICGLAAFCKSKQTLQWYLCSRRLLRKSANIASPSSACPSERNAPSRARRDRVTVRNEVSFLSKFAIVLSLTVCALFAQTNAS